MRPQGSDGGIILVVDDDPLVKQLVARCLSDAGHGVILAGNGEEGLAVAATLPGKLRLVVTDIRMPVMDGLTMAGLLKENHPVLPVLFISGFATVDEGAALAGQVLTKPFTPGTLLQRVREMLDTRSAAAKPAQHSA